MTHVNYNYDDVLNFRRSGMKISEIVNETGLSRSCINNWINRGAPVRAMKNMIEPLKSPIELITEMTSDLAEHEARMVYSFVLGMYLGDGCIHAISRSMQFTLSLDKKYNELNEYVIAVCDLLFNRKASIYDRSVDRGQKTISNCINVKYCNKLLGILFPQHGVGKKHTRIIELSEWQLSFVNDIYLCQGLFFSDGCYYFDKANSKWMYSFTNKSSGIVEILRWSLDRLGIRSNIRDKGDSQILTVKHRSDVSRLHDMIGDKNSIVDVRNSFIALKEVDET